ncbi:hypothetical protein [Acidihalobacter ferrooxydans]|uniref:hypothetical protein n=1 Tax=Acidihalobacter ferrooxydans TaxID=1765967 RepID=UPI0012EB7F45|nr:hypothetical protein [Acidihalobacter ferrooxydans]
MTLNLLPGNGLFYPGRTIATVSVAEATYVYGRSIDFCLKSPLRGTAIDEL